MLLIHLFCVCCPIICLYVQRSVLFVGMTAHSFLFHVICVCLRIVVTNTYCLVFFFIVILNRPLFFFSSLDLYCIVYSIIYCFCLSLCYLRHSLAVDVTATQTRVRCSYAEVSATQILPSSLQYGYEISMSQTTIDLSVL